MKEYIINNENHKNLTSNVPFKKLPKWFQKAETRNAVIEYDTNKYYTTSLVWKDGVWEDGIWKSGIWEYGFWEDGIWKNGFVYIRIKNSIWKVFYNSNTKEIKIGCKIKSIEEWEEWFSGLEEYTTERGTEEFKAIYKNYLLAKYAIELEIKEIK